MLDAFFFFIAGISPKVKVLDEKPRRCPVCGLHQAYFKRVDHYLSLFFIPIIKVKTGEPVIMCARCERAVSEFGPEPATPVQGETKRCRFCSRNLSPDYTYCPHCGKKL
ncbi:MAG TPA: zinc ribbon domain-containing protein [Desulfobacterales bacterium]|nr:zinc ribbon domain-containing protein [Desulfobacterales bacterium]